MDFKQYPDETDRIKSLLNDEKDGKLTMPKLKKKDCIWKTTHKKLKTKNETDNRNKINNPSEKKKHLTERLDYIAYKTECL